MVFVIYNEQNDIAGFSASQPKNKKQNYFEINRELAERINREFGHQEGFLIYNTRTRQAMGAQTYVIELEDKSIGYINLNLGQPQLILRNAENFDEAQDSNLVKKVED